MDIYVYLYIYIYIYREIERERERSLSLSLYILFVQQLTNYLIDHSARANISDRQTSNTIYNIIMCIHMCIYIYSIIAKQEQLRNKITEEHVTNRNLIDHSAAAKRFACVNILCSNRWHQHDSMAGLLPCRIPGEIAGPLPASKTRCAVYSLEFNLPY